MITPDMLAECGTEDGHQAALFCWIQQYPIVDWICSMPSLTEVHGATIEGRLLSVAPR
jgi:hypothetical protein